MWRWPVKQGQRHKVNIDCPRFSSSTTHIYIYTFCLKSRSLFIHMKDNITTKLKDQMLRQKKEYSILFII